MIGILLGMAVGFGLLLAGALQRRVGWLRAVCSRAVVSYGALALMFLGAEAYLRLFYVSTDTSLAHTEWRQVYWQTNSLGFRDREWTPADFESRRVVIVSGDSIAAGWGIENPDDRFSGVLQAHLGDDYAVANIGESGSPTLDSLRRIREFPYQQPDTIILQYFLNDIESAANSLGLPRERPPAPVWARESHLLNLVYERYIRSFGMGETYWDWSYAAYDNWRIWEVHEANLRRFAAYADEVGARLIVVIFPNMQDPVGSIPYVDRVAHVFDDYAHVEVLKLFDDVAAWDTDTDGPLIVSALDAHPSEAFHKYVGDKLYALYFADADG